MKILHIVRHLHKLSGVSVCCAETCDALVNNRDEVEIAVKSLGDVNQIESTRGVVHLPTKDVVRGPCAYDVVHIHNLWTPDLHQAAVWARRAGVPIVWSLHGTLSPWSFRYKWWKKCLPWHLYQKRDLKSAAILHVTSEQERLWVQAAGFSDKTIVNIPFGTRTRPACLRQHEVNRLLFVGRIAPVKSLEKLIMAWSKVDRTGWMLRVVGVEDFPGYTDSLRALCASLKVCDSVEFAGAKFGEDLEREYQEADVLALVSETENFGAVVVDALAWGLPVITSKGTPWREVEGTGGEGRGARSRLTAELHTSPSASHFVSFARFKDLAEKRPEELTFEEKSEIVHAIETTEMICLEMPKDEKITRFLKGYWDGDAKVIREIVDWGSGLVPVRVINRYIGEIQTHKNSIRSILFHTRFRGPLKVLILERLADVLKDAVLYNKGRDGDETVYNLAHRLRFDPGDGKPVKEFIVRLIVKETAEGNRTWTVEFSNKKELTGMPTTGEAATVEVTHLKSPSTHTILKLIYAVNAGEEGRGARSTVESNDLSRCGWWVDNDPETLAKALREAMSLSDEERRQMGEVGRQLVEVKYTWSAVAKKMGECYESLKV